MVRISFMKLNKNSDYRYPCQSCSWLENHMDILKKSLVFPLLLFSISLHWSLEMTFLFLLAILWNSAFTWIHLCFSPLPLDSLLFSAISKASPDSRVASLHFFFLGMVLIPVSCTRSWTSVHSSSGTLSDLVPWIDFSLPMYNCKGFDLGHTWMV